MMLRCRLIPRLVFFNGRVAMVKGPDDGALKPCDTLNPNLNLGASLARPRKAFQILPKVSPLFSYEAYNNTKAA